MCGCISIRELPSILPLRQPLRHAQRQGGMQLLPPAAATAPQVAHCCCCCSHQPAPFGRGPPLLQAGGPALARRFKIANPAALPPHLGASRAAGLGHLAASAKATCIGKRMLCRRVGVFAALVEQCRVCQHRDSPLCSNARVIWSMIGQHEMCARHTSTVLKYSSLMPNKLRASLLTGPLLHTWSSLCRRIALLAAADRLHALHARLCRLSVGVPHHPQCHQAEDLLKNVARPCSHGCAELCLQCCCPLISSKKHMSYIGLNLPGHYLCSDRRITAS